MSTPEPVAARVPLLSITVDKWSPTEFAVTVVGPNAGQRIVIPCTSETNVAHVLKDLLQG